MQAPALADPAGARRSLIGILGLVAQGAKASYDAETEAQAREAFDIARAITDQARAPFRVLVNALEVRATDTGGLLSFAWKMSEEIGDLIDAE